MKMLGNSRSIARVLAMAVTTAGAVLASGVAVSPAYAQDAKPAPSAKPAAKPTTPAATPATPPKPAAAGDKAAPAKAPTDKPAADKAAAKPVAKKNEDKALLASGQKKLDAGDHAGALADFEASYAAKPSPEAQRGIALAQDKLGHYPEAVAAYEKFVAEATPKMKTEIEEAQKRVEAIKAMPGKVHLDSTPPGALVVVDPPAEGAATPSTSAAAPSSPAAPSPTPVDVELAPGKHKVRFTSEGFEPAEKDVDVTYASKQDVKVDLVAKPPPPPPPVAAQPPPPPAPPPPPPPVEERSKVPAIVTGAVALAAAGVGTAFGLKALSQSNDYDKHPTTKLADDGENNALVADMMFGVAITFGVTSAVLFLSSDAPKQTTALAAPKTAKAKAKANPIRIIPAPYVTPTGGGAGAVVKF